MTKATHKMTEQMIRLVKGIISALEEWLREEVQSTKN